MSQTTANESVSLIITKKDFQEAELVQSLSTNTQGKKEYLNTLAIHAVSNYLEFLGIKTDLESSDLFDNLLLDFDKVNLRLSDLDIDVECRPILPGDNRCIIPPETRNQGLWYDCLGYFAVEIDEDKEIARILGFYPAVNFDKTPKSVSINDFQSVDYFFEYKENLDCSLHGFVYSIRENIKNTKVLSDILQEENIRNLVNCCLQSILAEELSSEKIKATIFHNLLLNENTLSKIYSDGQYTLSFERIANSFLTLLQNIWRDFDFIIANKNLIKSDVTPDTFEDSKKVVSSESENLESNQQKIKPVIDFLASDDEVAERVRETLASNSYEELIRQFLNIYDLKDEEQQLTQGSMIFKNLMGIEVKEPVTLDRSISKRDEDDVDFKLRELTEDFLEKLKDIWKSATKFSIIDSLKIVYSQGIDAANKKLDELAEQASWLWVNYQPIAAGKSIRSSRTRGENPTENLTEDLVIDGEKYQLIIKPIDVDFADLSNKNKWTFELRIVEQGATIPPGYKLRLLDQNGDCLSEIEAIEGEAALLFKNVEFETGDGIILDIKPTPDNYYQKIICFDSLIP